MKKCIKCNNDIDGEEAKGRPFGEVYCIKCYDELLRDGEILNLIEEQMSALEIKALNLYDNKATFNDRMKLLSDEEYTKYFELEKTRNKYTEMGG